MFPPHGAVDQASRDRGASSAEYALLIALIAAVIVGALAAFGGSVTDLFAFALPEGP